MPANHHAIERLRPPVSDSDLWSLATLLVNAVESGAAVSFVAPFTVEAAEAWWRKTLSASHPKAVFLVARDLEGIAGTVQLHPAWAPNQPHRAEVAKLIVHRRSRGSGLGRRLMSAIEDAARQAGFTLLTLTSIVAMRSVPAATQLAAIDSQERVYGPRRILGKLDGFHSFHFLERVAVTFGFPALLQALALPQ